MVELGIYNGIPHLLVPVVTDPKRAASALNWAVVEMQNRYKLFAKNDVRNLGGYNDLMRKNDDIDKILPEVVIIIDELADLMMIAKDEVEDAINRLAALARAAGMYLVIATQRPSVNVITGVIKANIPSRISFAVTSQVDSRTIIDGIGAEKLLGRGDMLYYPRGASKPVRVQGNFVSDQEIEALVDYVKSQGGGVYDSNVLEHLNGEREMTEDKDNPPWLSERDMFFRGLELFIKNGGATLDALQHKLRINYELASKLMKEMEENGYVGPSNGANPREVYVTKDQLELLKLSEEE
jgi:S-DNA-T family DNA segregation ATPase FtsK/SpoIIIE